MRWVLLLGPCRKMLKWKKKYRSLLLENSWESRASPRLHFISLRRDLLPVLSSSFTLSLFYLFRYYFHSRKDKERLKNKWSELDEEELKGKTFPSCRINMASSQRVVGAGEIEFFGRCLLFCIIITKVLCTDMNYLPVSLSSKHIDHYPLLWYSVLPLN